MFSKCHQTVKQIAMGSQLGAANSISRRVPQAKSLLWKGNVHMVRLFIQMSGLLVAT